MSDPELRARYLRYIAVLNERRFDELDEFVAGELVYNGERMTARQYRELLETDVRNIPDLHFDVRTLVVDDGQVACRILFDCTPLETFRGFEPTGLPVAFTEHVFYRFEHGRITRVWSLLDLEAIARQLPRSGRNSSAAIQP